MSSWMIHPYVDHQQGTVLKSEVNQQRYVVHGSLGGGGFGDAYEVSRLDERDQESSTTCLKISPDADIWHGEAFFGGLLLSPLTKLHRMGTSHRDITPSNVFIGNRSMLKLGDFGLAKVFQVGLLALTLLAGEPVTNTVRLPEVNQLAAKGPFRDAIKKAPRLRPDSA